MRELDRVIGYEDIKKELYKLLDIIQNPEKYAALGVTIPKGLLLTGNPGIGKTLMAKCFITESGRKSFVIRKDKPDGAFVDYIRETFEKAADEAPSIILLDDMDKFANEDVQHPNAEEYVTVQSCIDDVKDKDVFVIATCNNTRSLPGSLRRSGRFDKFFAMKFPKSEDATKILSFYLKTKKVADDIDVEELARFSEGHSCADLESVVNEAGIYAGYENKKLICQEDLIRACLRKIHHCYETLDDDSESLRRIAVHEAGHAVVTELYFPGQVTFASIEKNPVSGGRVLRHRDENEIETFDTNEFEIMINLAGKAATELMLNEVDMGVNNDLEAAFDYTRALLDNVASYDFNSWCHGAETSKHVFDHLDAVTGAEVSRYYLKTKQLLGRNREFLEAIVEALMEKKTLSYKDIAPIREKYVHEQVKAA